MSVTSSGFDVNAKPRLRNARAAANDTAITSAGVSEILRVGVDRISLREVAQRAGLTHGAAYARFEDVNEMLIDLWQLKLSGSATELLELCHQAVEEGSEAGVRALLDRIRAPQPEDVAMAEMMLVARRKTIVYEEIEIFIKKHVYPADGLTEEAKALFVRSLGLFGFALVAMVEGHYFSSDQGYLDIAERILLAALQKAPVGVGAKEVASETVSNEEVAPPRDEDDNLRARLVFATYVVIAKSGYHDATVSRIARRADCSPGAIYKLYRSKQDLVLEAFGTVFGVSQTATALRASSGLAEILSPTSGRRVGRRTDFALETVVAAAHIEDLRSAVASYLADPDHQIPEGLELDHTQLAKSGACIHSLAILTHGMAWISAITSSDPPNFDEFSEAVRLAHANT